MLTVPNPRLIPGAMKTYWLEHRESRPPLSRVLPLVISDVPELEWERSADAVLDIVERNTDMNMQLAEERTRTYSPVTFQEVARHSISRSPVREYYRGSYNIRRGPCYRVKSRAVNSKCIAPFGLSARTQCTMGDLLIGTKCIVSVNNRNVDIDIPNQNGGPWNRLTGWLVGRSLSYCIGPIL